jgi:hypothetical protein
VDVEVEEVDGLARRVDLGLEQVLALAERCRRRKERPVLGRQQRRHLRSTW